MAGGRVIPIRTASGAYDVHVGAGILDEVGALVAAEAPTRRAHVVSDSNVAPLYLGRVIRSLEAAGIACSSQVFPAGEASKVIGTWADVVGGMGDAGLDRDSVVVALGGGVTGDLAGFAAATYMRGIRVVQVPTSLLAMVDSSVGGKTAVDIPQGKNLVGAFLQPSVVVADVLALDTLPDGTFADACGEVIKHAVLADPKLLDELGRDPLTARRHDSEALVATIARNVEIKRDVVEQDETELGLRQTLNLGHTLGHAIEAASGFSFGHGSCVAAGLCMVSRYAGAEGLLAPGDVRRIEQAVVAHGLPTGTDLDAETLASYALSDKKRHGGVVNLVVPREVGRCDIMPVAFDVVGRIAAEHARRQAWT